MELIKIKNDNKCFKQSKNDWPDALLALAPDGLILESYLPSPIIESKIRFSMARKFCWQLKTNQNQNDNSLNYSLNNLKTLWLLCFCVRFLQQNKGTQSNWHKEHHPNGAQLKYF